MFALTCAKTALERGDWVEGKAILDAHSPEDAVAPRARAQWTIKLCISSGRKNREKTPPLGILKVKAHIDAFVPWALPVTLQELLKDLESNKEILSLPEDLLSALSLRFESTLIHQASSSV